MRRTWLALLFAIGLVVVVALGADAQTSTIRRVGLLTGGSEPGSQTRFETLRRALRDLGHVDGQSIALEYRYGDNIYERLPTLAAELVRLKVSVIVTNGTPASLAAKRATSTIPIVMFETADPVGSNLVSSLARPGGNVTGVAQLVSAELFGKQLEMLKEIVPRVSRVALLFNPKNPVQQAALNGTLVSAQALGVAVQPLGVDRPDRIEAALTTAMRNGTGALIVTRDNIFVDHLGRLVELCARYRLPTMYGSRPFASAGGLIAYGPDPVDSAQRAALYVDKILKGARPADLPVEQPAKFELVINLKTAKALGLAIPQPLLLRADQVIE
jgi:putative ABC transport system substrate-binding protein